MKTLIYTLLFSCFTLVSSATHAQRNVTDSMIPSTWLVITYGGGFTEGDLAERYGYMNHIGFFAGYKTGRNWVFGLDASYLFGGKVNLTGLFDHLVDSNGNITDQNGDVATVRVMPRGFYANGVVGKVLPVFNPNPNSGLYVNFGVGYLLHKLRVETQDHVVPQIELDYRKGYDRMTTGINTSQFIGYALMANESPINFFAGFYAQQGFTYNRRTINFDTPNVPVSTELRLDLQFGFKVGWMIPVYQRQPKEYYFD
jgi:hypothetical protein